MKAFQPLLKCLFLTNKPKGYSAQPLKSFYKALILISMKWLFQIVVNLYHEYRIPKLVKVKAYKRIRRGKVERVRSHYRLVRGR